MIFESDNDYMRGYTEVTYDDKYIGLQNNYGRFILYENLETLINIKEYAFGNKAYIEILLKENSNFDASKFRVAYRVKDIEDTIFKRICYDMKAMKLSEKETITELFVNSLW